jgi:glycosyltransferase involved in cell wall biosynthesis
MMKLALAHEWLDAYAGSEATFAEMAACFPDADLYALSKNPALDFVPGRAVRTTILDRGRVRDTRALTLPLMPAAWRSLRTRSSYDAVVTSSHAFARWFPTKGALHLSYTYTPVRYVWSPEIDGRGAGHAMAGARAVLRRLDQRSVAWVDDFASISTEVASRVLRFYGRESRVIFPPVDVDFFSVPLGEQRASDVVVSFGRFVPYKKHDVAIRVAKALGVRAVIVGSGPDEARLRSLAQALHPTGVEFVRQPTREAIRRIMQMASVLVFASHEDFGIVPVEAQASGLPVVALGIGGVLDTVQDGVTGLHVPNDSTEEFAAAVESALAGNLDSDECKRNAQRFSREEFRKQFSDWVNGAVG